jgi:hypothetical protein
MPNPDLYRIFGHASLRLIGYDRVGKSRIAISICKSSLYSKTPKCRTPTFVRSLTPVPCERTAQISSVNHVSRFRVARTLCIRIPDTPIPDMPNSDSPGSSATCPRPDRRFRSIREIATRDFTRCRTLTLSIPERRNPEVRWTLVLHTCTHGLSPAQLLHDRTVLGISRNFPGITSRRFSSS